MTGWTTHNIITGMRTPCFNNKTEKKAGVHVRWRSEQTSYWKHAPRAPGVCRRDAAEVVTHSRLNSLSVAPGRWPQQACEPGSHHAQDINPSGKTLPNMSTYSTCWRLGREINVRTSRLHIDKHVVQTFREIENNRNWLKTLMWVSK